MLGCERWRRQPRSTGKESSSHSKPTPKHRTAGALTPPVTIHIGIQFLILHLEYAFCNALLHHLWNYKCVRVFSITPKLRPASPSSKLKEWRCEVSLRRHWQTHCLGFHSYKSLERPLNKSSLDLREDQFGAFLKVSQNCKITVLARIAKIQHCICILMKFLYHEQF